MEVTGIKNESNSNLNTIFHKYGQLQHFNKNSYIFSKGEMASNSYYIESGLVKVCQLTPKGQSVTFFVRKPDDWFGVAEIILQQEHPCFAQCILDSKIWVLPASILQEKIYLDPVINREVLATMSARLLQHQSTVEQLISKSASARLASLLMQLSVHKNGEITISPMLTHEEMSNIIGCSRQTISELLSDWKSEGLISYHRNKFIIHHEKELSHYI